MPAPDLPESRFPISIDLRDRAVWVVGAGTVGARRTQRALDCGALVTLISPRLHPDLREAGANENLLWLQQTWQEAEPQMRALEPAHLPWLVLAATDDPQVNEEIRQWCEQRRIWCNRADDRHESPAWVPALASWPTEQGVVQVAVTSDAGPKEAIAIRDSILRARQGDS